MLKSIKYNDICQKFHRGINLIKNEEIIDVAMTSFGGFTDEFYNGTGRRVEVPNDTELSVSTIAEINDNTFHFARCYTNYQLDTKDLDKRQDIVKYANQIEKQLKDKKLVLPIIAYYNNLTEYTEDNNSITTNVLDNRDYGYSNCLIVKNKFVASFEFFKYFSFMAWQKTVSNIEDKFVLNYNKAKKNISIALSKIGYDNVFYEPAKNCIMVSKNNELIKLIGLDKDIKNYIAIVFDINMKCLMLNPYIADPFSVEGCVGVTYNFEKKNMISKLACVLSKQFPKIQILI